MRTGSSAASAPDLALNGIPTPGWRRRSRTHPLTLTSHHPRRRDPMNTPAMNVSAATIARPARRRWHRTGWGAMTALILVTLAFVSKYVGMNPANFLVQQREVYLAHETMLALHICGASTA